MECSVSSQGLRRGTHRCGAVCRWSPWKGWERKPVSGETWGSREAGAAWGWDLGPGRESWSLSGDVGEGPGPGGRPSQQGCVAGDRPVVTSVAFPVPPFFPSSSSPLSLILASPLLFLSFSIFLHPGFSCCFLSVPIHTLIYFFFSLAFLLSFLMFCYVLNIGVFFLI